ncbi:MAG: hypothetical protein ACP5E4_00610 [Candidatus Aenigmatarchaeota archaeon]
MVKSEDIFGKFKLSKGETYPLEYEEELRERAAVLREMCLEPSAYTPRGLVSRLFPIVRRSVGGISAGYIIKAKAYKDKSEISMAGKVCSPNSYEVNWSVSLLLDEYGRVTADSLRTLYAVYESLRDELKGVSEARIIKSGRVTSLPAPQS